LNQYCFLLQIAFLFGKTITEIRKLTTVSIKEPIIAVTKELIEKPGTKKATISKRTAFITKRNIPNVTSIKGRDKRIKIGLNMALTTPKTILVRRMLVKLWK
jgi:hypothetical protein